MRRANRILIAAVVIALAVYAFDCGATTTPEQAMQCCDSMPCSSQGHHDGQDCCKTMPSMHAPFVQPSPLNGAFTSSVVLAVLPGFVESQFSGSSAGVIAAHCHAPPIFYAPAAIPLRI
jgi:hypothetical protein